MQGAARESRGSLFLVLMALMLRPFARSRSNDDDVNELSKKAVGLD